jgi:hypothetical protein
VPLLLNLTGAPRRPGRDVEISRSLSANGVNLGTIGVILIIVGILGPLITVAMLGMGRTDVVYRPDGSTVLVPWPQVRTRAIGPAGPLYRTHDDYYRDRSRRVGFTGA